MLVKKIDEEWRGQNAIARDFRCRNPDVGIYEIRHHQTPNTYVYNAALYHCPCKLIDKTGKPCLHAMRVYLDLQRDSRPLYEFGYTRQAYTASYKRGIAPPAPREDWEIFPEDAVGMPKVSKKRGRKEKVRKKAGQGPGVGICPLCLEKGHFESTCHRQEHLFH